MKTFTATDDYHGTSFNKKFNPETGEETVSVMVGRAMALAWVRRAGEYDEGKEYLKYVACGYMGRSCDLDRCRNVGVREHNDGRIEFRLRFGPPWYWNLNDLSRQQSARETSASESGTLGKV